MVCKIDIFFSMRIMTVRPKVFQMTSLWFNSKHRLISTMSILVSPSCREKMRISMGRNFAGLRDGEDIVREKVQGNGDR